MAGSGMKALFHGAWWMFLLKGIVAILFGFLALLAPGLAMASLIMAFGFYALLDGASTLWAAIRGRKLDGQWWLLALEGLLGMLLGWYAFTSPGAVSLAFLMLFGLWAIAGGILRIVLALRLRKEIEGEWFLIGGGILSVLFGGFLLTQPVAGMVSILWMVGVFAILVGGSLVALALRARSFAKRIGSAVGA